LLTSLAIRSIARLVVPLGGFDAFVIQHPISPISGPVIPRVVTTGVPSRMPEGSTGLRACVPVSPTVASSAARL
jgi:hypothetical protein